MFKIFKIFNKFSKFITFHITTTFAFANNTYEVFFKKFVINTEEASESSHQAVGISLLIGFVFMLLIDQLGGNNHSHANSEIRLGRFC